MKRLLVLLVVVAIAAPALLSVERRASARRQRAEARRSTQTDAELYVEIAPSVRYRSAVSTVVRDAATLIVSGR